jgi:quinol monooxygenase YgiN
MIHVIASVRVKAGKRAGFLEIFRANAVTVRREEGCIEYFPAVDAVTDLPPQRLDENMVTIIEKWQSLGTLRAHLGSPHMLAYREKVVDFVEEVTLKILEEV